MTLFEAAQVSPEMVSAGEQVLRTTHYDVWEQSTHKDIETFLVRLYVEMRRIEQRAKR